MNIENSNLLQILQVKATSTFCIQIASKHDHARKPRQRFNILPFSNNNNNALTIDLLESINLKEVTQNMCIPHKSHALTCTNVASHNSTCNLCQTWSAVMPPSPHDQDHYTTCKTLQQTLLRHNLHHPTTFLHQHTQQTYYPANHDNAVNNKKVGHFTTCLTNQHH